MTTEDDGRDRGREMATTARHDDPTMWHDPTMWTIGHWTLSEEEFARPLIEAGVTELVDVRALPGSRRSPQFDADRMPAWLGEEGIGYRHAAALGGRRRRQDVGPDVNAAWQNRSFKNYADYTLTPQFQEAFEELRRLASEHRTVIMCGEPVPWRCHRLLISNCLAARGWTVWHLMPDTPPRPHQLGQWGAEPVVGADLTVTYPAQ